MLAGNARSSPRWRWRGSVYFSDTLTIKECMPISIPSTLYKVFVKCHVQTTGEIAGVASDNAIFPRIVNGV